VQGTGALGLRVMEKRDFYKQDNRVIKWNKGKEKSIKIVKGSV
jgi:hypothetical protein